MKNENNISMPPQEPVSKFAVTYEGLKEYIDISTFDFNPSQQKISFPIIERICKRLQAKKTFSPIKINNDIIIDGHHRYISHCYLKLQCSHILGQENVSSNDSFSWKEVALDNVDYDTEEEIKRYEERYDS